MFNLLLHQDIFSDPPPKKKKTIVLVELLNLVRITWWRAPSIRQKLTLTTPVCVRFPQWITERVLYCTLSAAQYCIVYHCIPKHWFPTPNFQSCSTSPLVLMRQHFISFKPDWRQILTLEPGPKSSNSHHPSIEGNTCAKHFKLCGAHCVLANMVIGWDWIRLLFQRSLDLLSSCRRIHQEEPCWRKMVY